MLLGIWLGVWGVQRFYLRSPGMGWCALVICKGMIISGLILLLNTSDFALGLTFIIAGPAIAEAIGLIDAVALASGRMTTDGTGKPLGP